MRWVHCVMLLLLADAGQLINSKKHEKQQFIDRNHGRWHLRLIILFVCLFVCFLICCLLTAATLLPNKVAYVSPTLYTEPLCNLLPRSLIALSNCCITLAYWISTGQTFAEYTCTCTSVQIMYEYTCWFCGGGAEFARPEKAGLEFDTPMCGVEMQDWKIADQCSWVYHEIVV